MTELSLERLLILGETAGFDAIGATSAEPFDELEERLVEYAKRGRTGYEHEDVSMRVNPKLWMPEAKSLISVAMAYLTPEGKRLAKQHPKNGRHGNVTVYSYGEDYHRVMQNRLAHLTELIEREVGHGIRAKLAVDTSPMVDRRVAERAGIGWVGKNCMFFTPQHGSFVFLGTLAVDIEVETANREVAAPCGDCSLCITACPTGAILAPGVIDAQRCLSYITQMKGIIPVHYRSLLGRRVWGCDTCQWVCPENKSVDSASHPEYLPHGELEYPDLIEILQLSNREFMRRYGKTAAAWRGLRTWQRNALIALGNLRSASAVDAIIPFLKSERLELRVSAAWALQRIGGTEAIQAVREAHEVEVDELARNEMQWAVEDLPIEDASTKGSETK